jgi:hypothetical protein
MEQTVAIVAEFREVKATAAVPLEWAALVGIYVVPTAWGPGGSGADGWKVSYHLVFPWLTFHCNDKTTP